MKSFDSCDRTSGIIITYCAFQTGWRRFNDTTEMKLALWTPVNIFTDPENTLTVVLLIWNFPNAPSFIKYMTLPNSPPSRSTAHTVATSVPIVAFSHRWTVTGSACHSGLLSFMSVISTATIAVAVNAGVPLSTAKSVKLIHWYRSRSTALFNVITPDSRLSSLISKAFDCSVPCTMKYLIGALCLSASVARSCFTFNPGWDASEICAKYVALGVNTGELSLTSSRIMVSLAVDTIQVQIG